MSPKPGNIKVILAAGVPVPQAIKAALPGGLVAFAARHKFHRSHVSMCINGHQRLDRVRAALAEELGVEREWLDAILDQQMAAWAAEKVAA
jgi:hypothetical protein